MISAMSEGAGVTTISMSATAPPLSAAHSTPDSVRSRYVVTLGSQVFRLLLSVVSATIVPRTLGPIIYGNYSFLLSTAATLRGLLDNGAQQAFFTFSSQEPDSGPLTRLYAFVLVAQLVIVLAIVGLAATMGRTDWLWHAQKIDQILWVTVLDWVMFLATSLQQLGDSKGRTVTLQLTGAAVSLLAIVGLLLLWLAGHLNFYTFVWLNLAGAGVTSVLLGHWLLVRNRVTFWGGALRIRGYIQRWWRFARPVLLLQYYLPLVTYLGVYLIQRWYGSQEQGYYGLALQWSAFAMTFTNAAVTIFWREIAHHHSNGDARATSGIYRQFSQVFFFLAAVLACWLSASSGALVRIVAGERYSGAGVVLAVMAFYPLAQTMGQLTVAALKATERTASYARLSVLLSLPDVLLTYLLLAPRAAWLPGLELGALGLAIKTAVYGLVSVQLYDHFNCRVLGLSYSRAFGARVAALGTVAATALIILNWGDSWLLRAGLPSVAALALSSCVYGTAVVWIVWLRPQLLGLSREQILRGVRLLWPPMKSA
jgi:O-antigen/teichoic acid export membrane protein